MMLLRIENATVCEYLLDHSPVLIFWNELTGEMLIELTSFAEFLGYQSVEDMMSDDEVLDVFCQHINQTGQSPFRRV